MNKRITFIVIFLFSLPLIQGCGSEMATGAAIGGGFSELLRETVKGADADITRKKVEVIATYNAGVERGASIEELDELKREVDKMVLVEKGVDTGKKILGVDFSKPDTVALATTGLVELALLVFGGRKLIQTGKKYSAEKKGVAKALTGGGVVDASAIYTSIAAERTKLKIPIG